MNDSPSTFTLLQEANLTQREFEVLEQVKQAFTCKEISENLCIGLETVKTHRKKIISKLGIVGKTAFRRFILDLLAEENEMLFQQLNAQSHTQRKTTTHPKITPRGD